MYCEFQPITKQLKYLLLAMTSTKSEHFYKYDNVLALNNNHALTVYI